MVWSTILGTAFSILATAIDHYSFLRVGLLGQTVLHPPALTTKEYFLGRSCYYTSSLLSQIVDRFACGSRPFLVCTNVLLLKGVCDCSRNVARLYERPSVVRGTRSSRGGGRPRGRPRFGKNIVVRQRSRTVSARPRERLHKVRQRSRTVSVRRTYLFLCPES